MEVKTEVDQSRQDYLHVVDDLPPVAPQLDIQPFLDEVRFKLNVCDCSSGLPGRPGKPRGMSGHAWQK